MTIVIKPVRVEDVDTILLLEVTMEAMRKNKPNDRSAKDRCYAVAITDMEKLYAYFKTWIVDKQDDRSDGENASPITEQGR